MAAPAKRPGKSVILVSTGRTGTDFLVKFLNANFENAMSVQEEFGGRRVRFWSNRALAGQLTVDALRRKLCRRYRDRLERMPGEVFVEANPYLFGCLDVLSDVYHDPLILHVVRDPRAYIRSHINFGAYRGLKWLAAHFAPYWELKPNRILGDAVPPWRRMSSLERMAWRWTIINERLDHAETLFPGRYRRLSYEGLFARDGRGLREFVGLCGLTWRDGLDAELTVAANGSKRSEFPEWRSWSLEDARLVGRICGDGMRRYGYGHEPEWCNMVAPSEAFAA